MSKYTVQFKMENGRWGDINHTFWSYDQASTFAKCESLIQGRDHHVLNNTGQVIAVFKQGIPVAILV